MLNRYTLLVCSSRGRGYYSAARSDGDCVQDGRGDYGTDLALLCEPVVSAAGFKGKYVRCRLVSRRAWACCGAGGAWT